MRNTIVNVRGGSGSGKTHTVRQFFDVCLEAEPLYGPKVKKPEVKELKGYRLDMSSMEISLPVFIIGSYENTCGGCDAISSQPEMGDRIELCFKHGHVIYEGLLPSKAGPGGHLSPRVRELGGDAAWFAWLDTPDDVAVKRVIARREERGKATQPLDPNKSVLPGLRQARKSKVNLENTGDGYNTCWLKYDEDPFEQLVKLLRWSERQ